MCIRAYLLAALSAAVLMAVTAPHLEARTDCQTRSCNERVASNRCSQTTPVRCVEFAALRWDVSFAMLLRKARCESTLDPLARNGVHAGLFQFRVAFPSTWATTPYASRSPWQARWNALAAAWMHHVHRGGEWACR